MIDPLLNQEERIKAYGEELRKRIIKAREEGQSGALVARRYQITVRTVERYWRRYCETAEIGPKKLGGYRKSKLAPYESDLLRWIEQQPDLSLSELRERCRERLRVAVSINALWYRLERMGLSVKKNDARRRTRPTRSGH